MDTIIDEHTIVIKRQFSAPVDRVYNAWTDPTMLAQWFSPNIRWNNPLVENELKPGGRRSITMRHSDGDQMQITGTYLELVPNERLSFTSIFHGGPAGSDESTVTIELRSAPGGTELTLTHDRQTDPAAKEGASAGWAGCLEMLESYLAGNSPLGKHVP